MDKRRCFVVLVVLILAALACSGGGGDESSTDVQPPSSEDESPPPSSGDVETDFPLPRKYDNLMQVSESTINFQTPMSVEDVIDFYRDEFGELGYDEREIVTTITDTNFSMVFDGHPGGIPIVIQGFDLGGSTNVSIRFEDV